MGCPARRGLSRAGAWDFLSFVIGEALTVLAIPLICAMTQQDRRGAVESSTSPEEGRLKMRRPIVVLMFLIIAVLAMVGNEAHAITIKEPFVFVDRFPDESRQLGFTPGNVVQIGAHVTSTDAPIAEATARNLETGAVLTLTQKRIGAAQTDILVLLWPFPPFDPSTHKGVWEIKVKDEKGNEAAARTHRLDKVGRTMPYVPSIMASGDPLAPMITWGAPKQDEIPGECEIRYVVRLLKNVNTQMYISKPPTSDLKQQIPEGVLKPENVAETYVRIESQCLDKDDMDHAVPVELKSETFRSLKEALGK
jgi:hypothetical protein